jgi:hypothetical protein
LLGHNNNLGRICEELTINTTGYKEKPLVLWHEQLDIFAKVLETTPQHHQARSPWAPAIKIASSIILLIVSHTTTANLKERKASPCFSYEKKLKYAERNVHQIAPG